jgi:hypothetical protein
MLATLQTSLLLVLKIVAACEFVRRGWFERTMVLTATDGWAWSSHDCAEEYGWLFGTVATYMGIQYNDAVHAAPSPQPTNTQWHPPHNPKTFQSIASYFSLATRQSERVAFCFVSRTNNGCQKMRAARQLGSTFEYVSICRLVLFLQCSLCGEAGSSHSALKHGFDF